jgi:hypothetical protein
MERESVRWSNTLLFLRKEANYLATFKQYSVVNVLERVCYKEAEMSRKLAYEAGSLPAGSHFSFP